MTALKNPLTDRGIPGGGVGPGWDCGEARKTGKLHAQRSARGGTMLFFDAARTDHAMTMFGHASHGQVVDLNGWGFEVCWVSAAAEEAQPLARIAADPNVNADFARMFA